MKPWGIHHVTVPRLGVGMQIVMACILALTAVVAWSNWKSESGKRQTDATLRYFDRLMERDYIRYLWQIEEFTLCFERTAKSHLSYARFAEVRNSDAAFKLASRWWELVENDDKELEDCGKPDNVEEKLMVVYGRLEALASCAKQKLCSFTRIVDMIEAFDHMTLLSVSNYLLLTRDRDRKISREWTMSGALVDLVELIETYVFESRSSAVAFAARLDAKGPAVENAPTLRPSEITAMRNKRTRCDKPVEVASDDWRRCVSADKPD